MTQLEAKSIALALQVEGCTATAYPVGDHYNVSAFTETSSLDIDNAAYGRRLVYLVRSVNDRTYRAAI